MDEPENKSADDKTIVAEKEKKSGNRFTFPALVIGYADVALILLVLFAFAWHAHQYRQLGFIAQTTVNYFLLLFCVFFAKHLAFDYLWIFKKGTKPFGRKLADTLLAIMLVLAPTYILCGYLVTKTSRDADRAFENNNYSKACALYGRMHELLSPAYRGFDIRQGECLMELGQFQQAVDIYSRALVEHPALELYTARAKALGRLHRDKLSKIDRTAADHIEHEIGAGPSAQILFDNREFEDALNAYNELVAEDPKNAKNYVIRGKCFYQLSRDKEAVADFTHAITLNPKFGQAYYERSLAYKQLGQKELSEHDLAEAKDLGYAKFMP